ncbi:VTT domain-containing protein [Candidatus Wolfebacteria bacterium]|nr:VTT domain-containing protein [Candidatus Wolfebacteria bacterium]
MNSFLLHYLIWWKPVGYLIVFFGMMLEGDILLFTAGFLSQQHFLNTFYSLTLAFFGALIGDFIWYWLGRKLNGDKTPPFIKKWLGHLELLDNHLRDRPRRTIFISKFAYGFNHLTLMRAGTLGIRLADYIKANIWATIVWVLTVAGLGYLSGASFESVKRYLRFAEIALLMGLILFFLIWNFVVAKQFQKRL